MKIALVCPYDFSSPGGVAGQVESFARYAISRGHDVTVIAPLSGKSGYDSGIRVVSAGKAVPLPVGIRTGMMPRVTLSMWRMPAVGRILKNSGFDVVHVHEPGTPLLGPNAMNYTDPGKSAIIATFHSNTPINFALKSYIRLTQAAGLVKMWAGKLHAFIAVSEPARKTAINYLPKPLHGSFTIIPNAIDTKRFSPSAKPIEKSPGGINLLDGKLNILFVGRLGYNERRKGLEYLVRAFNRLHIANSQTRLIIVGPGKPDRYAQAAIKAGKGIVHAGQVPKDDLPRYYAMADIFCAPAIHGESFGMVLAEAMATGKPVIASDIEGYKEVVRETAGILVPPKDVEALEQALSRLASDARLRKRMGAKGRKAVVAKFDSARVFERILGVYRKAIRERNEPPGRGSQKI